MNDRFKFRVWDIENNRYGQFNYLNLHEYLTMPNRCIVEQCTGLKDKNGGLIYEGDIITMANGSINGNVFTSNWEVVWEDKNGKYRVPSWVSDKPDFSHFVEVIGNIHQNLELLEKANENTDKRAD